MFTPLPYFIGLRYTRSKKRNHFVSFISLTSMLGIALGVMVLITVLSVMNGFDQEIHKRFFGMAPEVTVNSRLGKITDWHALEKTLAHYPGVRAVAPFVGTQALVSFEGQVLPMVLTGISPEREQSMSHLQDKLLLGDLSHLGHFGMMVGRGLADHLGLMVGDQVTVMIPEASISPAGMTPRFKRFTIQGIFSAGAGFNFDAKLAFINLHDAQALLHLGDAVTGLKLKLKDVYAAPQLAKILQTDLGESFEVGSWADQFGAFFHAVKMEKTMMFLILLLIIAVAAFNLVSSLVMIVNDKQSEIAILRTLGATPGTILLIFMVQGMTIGLVGTALGLVSGVILAKNATHIVNVLQDLLHTRILSANVYFVDYLPSQILTKDLIEVCAIALCMSLLATLYPAFRASRTVIAEALHHE